MWFWTDESTKNGFELILDDQAMMDSLSTLMMIVDSLGGIFLELSMGLNALIISTID